MSKLCMCTYARTVLQEEDIFVRKILLTFLPKCWNVSNLNNYMNQWPHTWKVWCVQLTKLSSCMPFSMHCAHVGTCWEMQLLHTSSARVGQSQLLLSCPGPSTPLSPSAGHTCENCTYVRTVNSNRRTEGQFCLHRWHTNLFQHGGSLVPVSY